MVFVEWTFDVGGALGGGAAAITVGVSAWQWRMATRQAAVQAASRHLEEQRYAAYSGFVGGIAARRRTHRDYDRAQKALSWSPDIAQQQADAIHQAREQWYAARAQLHLLAPDRVIAASRRWEAAVSQDSPLRKNRAKGLDDGAEAALRKAFLEAAREDLSRGLTPLPQLGDDDESDEASAAAP